jgi:hypothetical protein
VGDFQVATSGGFWVATGAQNAAIELSYPAFGHEVLTFDEFVGAIEPARN